MLETLSEFYHENPMLVTTTFLIIISYIYYRLRVISTPVIYCNKNSHWHKLISSLQILSESYKPTFWCWESRFQSMMAAIVRDLRISRIKYDRQIFTFTDGGEVALDWARGDEDAPDSPIVLILPGITGSSNSDYAKALVNTIRSEVKARVVVFNQRGRGNVRLKSPRTYCAANHDDLSEILDFLNTTFPDAPVVALGVSLGGIILGNYLAEKGESARSKLLAAILISVCFDTFEGTKSLETPGLNRMLNRHLANALVQSIKEMKEQFDDKKMWNLEQVFSSTTVREFDSRFTAKMFGYKDVMEYYADARLADKVGNIKVPTLAINAEDDPFQPGDSLPKTAACNSSHLAIVSTRYGGHVGFCEGWIPTGYFWSDRLVSQFLQTVFNNRDMLHQ